MEPRDARRAGVIPPVLLACLLPLAACSSPVAQPLRGAGRPGGAQDPAAQRTLDGWGAGCYFVTVPGQAAATAR